MYKQLLLAVFHVQIVKWSYFNFYMTPSTFFQQIKSIRLISML